jgi:hypothetical protein
VCDSPSFNFSDVSNIDHQLRHRRCENVTAPSRHLSVTESVALPPNQGSVLCSIVRFPRFFMENPLASVRSVRTASVR